MNDLWIIEMLKLKGFLHMKHSVRIQHYQLIQRLNFSATTGDTVQNPCLKLNKKIPHWSAPQEINFIVYPL